MPRQRPHCCRISSHFDGNVIEAAMMMTTRGRGAVDPRWPLIANVWHASTSSSERPPIYKQSFCTLQRADLRLTAATAPTCMFAVLGVPTGADPKRDDDRIQRRRHGYNSK